MAPSRFVVGLTWFGMFSLATSLSGCVGPDTRGQPLVPTKSLTHYGPYRIWTHAPLPSESPTVHELAQLEDELSQQLKVKVDPHETPIDIYVLKDRTAFEQFLKFYYPELPTRRAFFLAQGNRRIVYTYGGAHLVEDVRHEVTHALMNASCPDLPLWLDEGLAEYFEVENGMKGLNAEHLDRLGDDLERGWKPDLARLEGLKDVRVLTSRDYREAWGWVHWMLRGSPKERSELLAYLADLRDGRATRPLSVRLPAHNEDLNSQFIAHLSQVREHPIATVPIAKTVIVRGQDAPLESAPRTSSKRRSLTSRFLAALGFSEHDQGR